MSRCYRIENVVFYPHKNLICAEGKQFNIRPKTSELLHELVKANGQIVTKKDLLDRVWNDVVVEEYVIFQSITELRKCFNDPKVIKTHPRKGYSIAVTVVEIDENATRTPQKDDNNIQNNNIQTNAVRPLRYVTLALTFLLLVIGAYFANKHFDNRSVDKGSIIVLPLNNRIEDASYRWIQYGGMDLLIQQLQPELDAPVLSTDQVLDVLKREGIGSVDIDESAINRLFEVTGAQLIVAQSLSGYSRDYQLVYSFYNRYGITRGALTGEETSELFFDLTGVLLDTLGLSKNDEKQTYQNDFANEVMATAIDHMQSERYQEAATMFNAVLVTEPENLSAMRMLVKSLVYQGDYPAAEKVASNSVKLAKEKGDEKNAGRLLFWQGLSTTQQERYEKALTLLQTAKVKSERSNDLLYLANGARVTGKIYLAQNNFNEARTSINEALSFYQAIQEPYGQASMYIDLGELELVSQNRDKAQTAFETALEIANKNRLQQLIDSSRAWLLQIEGKK